MASQNAGASTPQNTSATSGTPEDPQARVERLQKQLKWAIPRAQTAILWERTLPRLLPLAGLTAIFAASAAAGAWGFVPPDARMIGVAGFAIAAAASLTPLRRVRWASRDEAIARIDQNTGLPHNPVATVMGKPAGNLDEKSANLWKLHQQETAARIGDFKVGKPRHNFEQTDPYNLRYLAPVVMALGLAIGNVNTADNLRQPFDWTQPVPPPAPVIPARVDVWVTPPQYTRQTPIFLTDDAVVRAETPVGSTLNVPFGTRMTIRVMGGDSDVTITGGAEIERAPTPYVDPATLANPPRRIQPREYEIILNEQSEVRIEAQGDVVMSWRFDVTPDIAPRVQVEAVPNADRPDTLDLRYNAQDDYGIVQMQTEIENAQEPQSQSRRPPRPLVTPPSFYLPPPR